MRVFKKKIWRNNRWSGKSRTKLGIKFKILIPVCVCVLVVCVVMGVNSYKHIKTAWLRYGRSGGRHGGRSDTSYVRWRRGGADRSGGQKKLGHIKGVLANPRCRIISGILLPELLWGVKICVWRTRNMLPDIDARRRMETWSQSTNRSQTAQVAVLGVWLWCIWYYCPAFQASLVEHVSPRLVPASALSWQQ